MKKLLVLSLAIVSFQSQAGYWNYSCQSSDGKVTFTRDNLVIIEKEKSGAISNIITKNYTEDINTSMRVGESLTFKDSADSPEYNSVTVTFTKLIREKEIESVESECADGWEGDGPGHSVTKFVFRAQIKKYDEKMNVKLNCFETYGWGGRCHPAE